MGGFSPFMSDNVDKTLKKMKEDKVKKTLKMVGICAGISAASLVGAGLCVLAVPAVMGAIGFASGGVVAGSLAAAWQATLGGVIIKGSIFALLQSAGATGIISGLASAGVAAVGGTTTGGVAYGIHKIFNRSGNRGNDDPTDGLTEEQIKEHFPVLIAKPYTNV